MCFSSHYWCRLYCYLQCILEMCVFSSRLYLWWCVVCYRGLETEENCRVICRQKLAVRKQQQKGKTTLEALGMLLQDTKPSTFIMYAPCVSVQMYDALHKYIYIIYVCEQISRKWPTLLSRIIFEIGVQSTLNAVLHFIVLEWNIAKIHLLKIFGKFKTKMAMQWGIS